MHRPHPHHGGAPGRGGRGGRGPVPHSSISPEPSCQAAADRQATLPPLLKILGDRSKFQILCVLRQGGKYNSELAEELGLTPATMSHHMSILLANQLVTVEKREAKLRYQLNREAVGKVATGLAWVFGLEDMF